MSVAKKPKSSGQISKEKAEIKITDLCVQDRERIANLLRTLAKTAEEKDNMTKQLEQERTMFEQQKKSMFVQVKQLVKEKRAIKKSMEDCQKLITELHHVLYIQQSQGACERPLSDKISEDKKFSTTSVQTEDMQRSDNAFRAPLLSAYQQNSIPYSLERIPDFSSKMLNELAPDQRHAMEVALKRQELLLREKQALLQVKQLEFQKRFDYFATHGHFPDIIEVRQNVNPDHAKSISESATDKVHNQNLAEVCHTTPVSMREKKSTGGSPHSRNSRRLSPIKVISEKNAKDRSPKTTSTARRNNQAVAKKDASVEVDLERSHSNGSCCFVKQKNCEPGYGEEKELNDIANISALLASINDVHDSDNSMSSNDATTNPRQNPKILNEAVPCNGELMLSKDEATLLEDIFFLT